MDAIYKEVYEYLINLKILDKKEYNKLTSIYGSEIVHKVIDYMIDLDEEYIFKFDYYIDRLTVDFDKFSDKSSLSIYMQDIGRKPRLSHDESIMYATKCYNIVNELRELFKLVGCDYKKQKGIIFNSIIDEVEFYRKECCDDILLDKINELYNDFIRNRDILVNGNIRIVIVASKRYFRDVNTFIEIIQWGNMGLLQAAEKYNPNFNTKFITYAYYWIRQSIRNAVRYQYNIASTISYNAVEINNYKKKVVKELSNILGRIPSDEEIASYMGISIKRLEEISCAFQETVSLSSGTYKNDDGDNNPSIVEMIEDGNINVDRIVSLKVMKEELINVVLENLDEMQRFIVLNRCGFLGDIKTFKEIGVMYGCTKQHIEQTYKRSLLKIRRMSGDRLKDFLE